VDAYKIVFEVGGPVLSLHGSSLARGKSLLKNRYYTNNLKFLRATTGQRSRWIAASS
jgi:hypothetical protein